MSSESKIKGEQSVIELVKSSGYFSQLNESDLAELLGASEHRSFGAGINLIEEGTRGQYVWVLLSGSLRVLADGKQINEISDVGEVFGEISAVSRTAATASVQTVDEVEVLAIPHQALHSLMERLPEFATAMLRSMAKYLGAR